MAAPLLEIRNVKKYYPVKKVRNGEDIVVKAVDQINLTINQGEIVGLVRVRLREVHPRKDGFKAPQHHRRPNFISRRGHYVL